MKKTVSYYDTKKQPADFRKEDIADLQETAYRVLTDEPKKKLGYDEAPEKAKQVDELYSYLSAKNTKTKRNYLDRYMWVILIIMAAYLLFSKRK